MAFAPRLAASLMAALCLPPATAHAGKPRGTPAPAPQLFDSPAEALQAVILRRSPRVIALGEFHEVQGAPRVRSSLVHFRDELLPMLAPVASDLVLETWVTQGDCGHEEKQVVAQVAETTQRPETTETDLVKLIKRARALAVAPHILEMSCAGYRALLDDKGEVDYAKLLAAIARLLEKTVDAVRKERGPRETRAVLVYGGAVHNDLAPPRELRPFSYAPSLQKKTRGGLVAVNLFVPEFIERSEYMKAEPWYPQLAQVPPGKTALIRRGPASFIIVFARGVAAEAAAPAPDKPASGGAAKAAPPPDGGAAAR